MRVAAAAAQGGLRSIGRGASGVVRRWSAPVFSGLAVLALLELVSRGEVLPRRYVPPTSTIVEALYQEVQGVAFWGAVGDTLEGWALGLGLAVAAAIPLGMVIGGSRWIYLALRAPIDFLRAIPGLAWLPLLVLVIGIGFELKLYLITVGAFWPLLFQALYGVQDVDPAARDMARAYGLGRFAQFFRVVLPSATPYVATGLRISAIVALNVSVGVELIIGAQGIGDAIAKAQYGNRVPATYAYVAAAGTLGLLINIAFRRLERRVLHWHPSEREEVSA